jgi:uncharacterized protein (TIGR02145 family)
MNEQNKTYSLGDLTKFVLLQYSKFLILSITLVIFTSCKNPTVQIGEKIWMTKELDVDRFQNGDLIQEVKSVKEWQEYLESGEPAWCYYKNDKERYGVKLYNFYAVSDPRGLSPKGFHVPSDQELQSLCAYRENKKWRSNTDVIFSTITRDYREYNGDFKNTFTAYLWSSSEKDSESAFVQPIMGDCTDKESVSKGYGFSVLCVKDN